MKYGIYKTITRFVEDGYASDFAEYWHVWEYTVDNLPMACYCRQQSGGVTDGVESLTPEQVQGCLTLIDKTFDEYIAELREDNSESESIITYQWVQPLATVEGSADMYAAINHTHTGYAASSHTHTPASIGAAASSHNHDSAYISKDLQITGDNGGALISVNRDDGKNVLDEIAALPIGLHTVYSQSGTAGNPKTTEAWRFMVHKTGTNTGWVQGYGSIGSVYTNYQDGATTGWRGWRCIWDYDPNPLWSGQYYMSSPNSTPQTVTPSKKLSECRTGWLLLWSDYDAGSGSNDADFVTTIIPKNNPSGGTWGGKSFLCDIPRYVGSNAEDVDTERRIIKPIYVHDDRIEGSYQNDKDERNDVVLRAVYEI